MTTTQGKQPARRVLVIGHGMAGARLVDELLSRAELARARKITGVGAGTGASDGALEITVVGEEPYGAYNRVLLSEVVAGRADVAALQLADADSYRAAGVTVQLGTGVIGLDRLHRKAFLADGLELEYDRLVLATGARPVVPAVPGLPPTGSDGPLPGGVHALRTIDDCREIVAAAANARHVVVVGGGLLGLEAARGLARRGLPVTVLNAGAHPLDRRLDAPAGALVRRRLRDLGVAVHDRCSLQAVLTEADHVIGVDLTGPRVSDGGQPLDGGQRLPADLLILACGVRPETTLARAAGLTVAHGVVVDDALTTSDPAISALGDCAEHDGRVPGLVAPAWQQAQVLADLLTGADPAARYRGHRPVFRLKAEGLDVLAAGVTDPDPWTQDDDLDVVQLVDPGRGRYVKAVIRDDRVIGAICVGAPRSAAELSLLIDRGSPVPHDRATLLLPGYAAPQAPVAADDPTLIPDRATVCRCNGVTKGAVVSARQAGARTVEAVARRTRATTGCGSCHDAVAGLLDWLDRADPAPERPRPPAPAQPAVPTPAQAAAPTGTR